MPDAEQPDTLIQAAWSSGADKKAVINEGTDAAMLLLAGERNQIVTLFWPVPRPLEAVARWADNPRPVAGIAEGVRPFASAVIPGCVLGYIITQGVTHGGLTALVWTIVGTIIGLGLVFKLLIGAALRRQAARLDEQSAFAIVLDQLRLGMTVNAALAPRAAEWIRRGLKS